MNQISIKVDFVDDVTGVTIQKIFDFDNTLTNQEMNIYVKENAPAQEEFDAIKQKADLEASVDVRVEELKTFIDREFNV